MAFFHNLNKENYNKLLFALKTESPDRILNNIQAYFKKYNEVKERDVELEINKLVINNSDQLNYLFVSHEASRTGAPLIILELAKRLQRLSGIQPIFILCNGGEIEKDFKKIGTTYTIRNREFHDGFKKELRQVLKKITTSVAISKTYINSVESRGVLPIVNKYPLGKLIYLIHELGSYYPKGAWNDVDKYADRIVFPANFVKEKAIANSRFTNSKLYTIGQGLLKEELLSVDTKAAKKELRAKLNLPSASKIVLGCGVADARKGIDLFVNTAIGLLSNGNNSTNTFFVWLGSKPMNDHLLWAERDIEQSGFKSNILLVGSQTDTSLFFGGSDIFFLTCRGDPFPCVVHEAMATGLPIICFDSASGFTEVVRSNSNIGAVCSAGNIKNAEEHIMNYLENEQLVKYSSIASKQLVRDNYSMLLYAEKLEII